MEEKEWYKKIPEPAPALPSALTKLVCDHTGKREFERALKVSRITSLHVDRADGLYSVFFQREVPQATAEACLEICAALANLPVTPIWKFQGFARP